MIPELLGCKRLASFNLADNELSDGCSESIVALLNKTRKREIDLQDLNLSGNALTQQFVHSISIQLIQNENLKSFSLKDNHINAEGIQELLRILAKNNYILSLDLRDNPGFTKKASLVVLEKLKNNLNKFRLGNAVKKSAVRDHDKEEDNLPSQRSMHEHLKNRSRSLSRRKTDEDRSMKLDPVDDFKDEQEKPVKHTKHEEKAYFQPPGFKRSSSVAPEIVVKCSNCENLREKVIRLEFENKKLRIRINELNTKNPAMLHSCKLSRLHHQSFGQRIG